MLVIFTISRFEKDGKDYALLNLRKALKMLGPTAGDEIDEF